ncbi:MULTISPECIES: SGNH/GDSL hydrolase family protein [Cohaesibacter]|uniref:SGNH/GDSL hydrolase family protein n=1 Tax=Cohaesibacter TaxID=655352 RepID=UPI000DEB588D|nr:MULTISPECIES: DUF459 domain-containing protein [Cohaesibacter]TLP44939.1 DUF459 domain-containing protein [Cohaesibacter sp. CAU 1516]
MSDLKNGMFLRPLARIVITLLTLVTMSLGVAAEKTSDTSAEDKNPPKVVSIAVLGDSLADGLYAGLVQLSRHDKSVNLKVTKYSRVNTGLVRYDRYDWSSAAKKISKKDKSTIYILMFGANDLQTIRSSKKRHHYQSEGWLKAYKERIDTVLQSVKQPGRKVYWVGLPIVGKSNFAKGYQYLNGIFAERAKANGVTYIESWSWFASKNGKFQMSGPGADGKKRLLRAKDKVHFTAAGYRDLSHFVAREIELTK